MDGSRRHSSLKQLLKVFLKFKQTLKIRTADWKVLSLKVVKAKRFYLLLYSIPLRTFKLLSLEWYKLNKLLHLFITIQQSQS